jgi:dTDP-4-amino-4,6-dideoxygalactose transaminase
VNIPLVDLREQYRGLAEEINNVVLEVLSSGNYIMGESVIKFENSFSEYLGVEHSISVASGSDALSIALKTLGIGKGDEVITTPYTFFATAESISAIGATPVFVDVERESFNLAIDKIKEKITSATKAIIPVHIFGQSADMEEIKKLAKKYNLYVIEDACQAIGAQYKNEKIGTLGDIACFSFFPTKNLGCAGDGGMIVTNNKKFATIAKALRNHGSGENGYNAYKIMGNETAENIPNSEVSLSKYHNYLIGFNSRLDALQAEILSTKLKYIDKWNDARREHANFYNKHIDNKNVTIPYEKYDRKHVYHMYILQSEDRNRIIKYLNQRGIATGIYYPVPLHLQKVYGKLGYKEGDMPVAEYLSQRAFAIPIFPELTEEQRTYIVEVINNFK